MTNVDTATRIELELVILDMDLQDSLFGGIDNILEMSTDEIREKLVDYIIESPEF